MKTQPIHRQVVHLAPSARRLRQHEQATQFDLARWIAELRGEEFVGAYDARQHKGLPLYFVPADTLTSVAAAHAFGIHGEDDLFGGVVPLPFVATKVITHGVPYARSAVPRGWRRDLAARLRDVVLPGYSVFSLRDARIAGLRLLAGGRVRVKRADGIGGMGQSVVADEAALEALIDSSTDAAVKREGWVLERDLDAVVTLSVGQVRIAGLEASYVGTQELVPNAKGEDAYGGSTLNVVRGDYAALERVDLTPEARVAVGQARRYDAAVRACYPAFYASRCNYDIAQGYDGNGQWLSGVLEQSWRMGGASGAEIAALQAMAADAGLRTVRASTVERYGDTHEAPADAQVHFHGVDPDVGAMIKYTLVESHGHT